MKKQDMDIKAGETQTCNPAELTRHKSLAAIYKLLVMNSPTPIYIVQNGVFLFANPTFQYITEYSNDEIVGMKSLDLVHPEDRVLVRDNAVAMLKHTSKSRTYEFRLMQKSGSIRWVTESVISIDYEGQRAVLGTMVDLTDRKQAVEALRESEDFNTSLLRNSPNPIVVVNEDTSIKYVNRALEKLTGFTGAELIGMKPPYPWWQPNYTSRIGTSIKEGTDRREYLFQKKTGEYFWVEVTGAPINSSNPYYVANWVDITGRKRLEEKLKQSEQNYRLLVENQTDIVTKVDKQGRVLFVSPSYFDIFAQTEEDVIGKPFMPTMRRKDRTMVTKFLETLFAPPFKGIVEFRARTRNGWRWLAWLVKAIRDDAGNITGFVGSSRDITEKRTYRVDLEAANEKLRELDKLKDNFLSTVSHELRTPLTSIKSFVEILLNCNEDEQTQKEFLSIINDESDRLTRLINDFLDISKIQANRMQWQTVALPVSEVVQTAVDATRPLVTKAKLALSVETEADLPLVLCDRDRLTQVVTNLLGNAIKFTPEGGRITAKTWLQKDSDVRERAGMVTVSISDTGIGIASVNHERIFEKFYQVGDVLKDRPKGTGLGLAICKNIVEHYGGKIWVESIPGKGSTFFFSLPVAASTKSDASHFSAGSGAHLPIHKKTILVVDDEDNIRRFIKHELTRHGHKVIEASQGKEAVDLARKYHPDLITLDVVMPELDGFDVTAVLKNDPETSSIPILILSVVENKKRAYRMGVNDYITKPISIENLIDRVNNLLSGAHKNILIVDDDSSLVKSLEFELRQRGFSTGAAYDGVQALEMIGDFIPDIILLDIRMPRMDGYAVIKALKNNPDTMEIPIIIMTGIDIDGGRVKALSIGAADYISKTNGFSRLFESIEKIIAKTSDPGFQETA